MDLRVYDLQYRLQQTQRNLKEKIYLRNMYEDDIKELEKILEEIEKMIAFHQRSRR
jgi:chaperonin cofactor prefoldin